MDEEQDAFQQAPEGLRSTLANYKKGIEIVHRMISRAKDRKKELSAEMPVSVEQEIEHVDAPEDAERFAASVLALSEAFHKLRDANYHATQDARRAADACLEATLVALKQILSAIDGIDSGLASEPQVRARVAQFEEQESCHALAESWFGAYSRLNDCVDAFFSKTGIEAHSVEPGTPFDPNTMEPQGTVENPDMNNEDVATVLRRGFSLHGQPVRPILVDVVRNP
jgi:molecular chaperone GrpE (heat shock protein)